MASDQTGFTGRREGEPGIHYHDGSAYTDQECSRQGFKKYDVRLIPVEGEEVERLNVTFSVIDTMLLKMEDGDSLVVSCKGRRG